MKSPQALGDVLTAVGSQHDRNHTTPAVLLWLSGDYQQGAVCGPLRPQGRANARSSRFASRGFGYGLRSWGAARVRNYGGAPKRTFAGRWCAPGSATGWGRAQGG